MEIKTQFSVFLINQPGVLASVTGALAKAHVNVVALALMDSGEHGALRIVCDSPDVARDVLGKTHDRWTEAQVLVLNLNNNPGTFADVAEALANEHINITYAYLSSGASGGRTTAVFKIADMEKAMKVLAPKLQKKEAGNVRRPPTRR
jgi:hypothetical protein